MGAECVRMSPKITAQSHNKRTSESSKLRASDEMLHFEIIISDLELQCTAQVYTPIFRMWAKSCSLLKITSTSSFLVINFSISIP